MTKPPTFSVSIISTIDHEKAWHTLAHSVRLLDKVVNLTHVCWYSDQPLDESVNDSRWQWIPISVIKNMPVDYNQIIFNEFALSSTQDFNLVIQWDGYPCNLEAWTDEFLKYDYIGAVWPWTAEKVGNGGFSLRSRKLLDSLRAMDTAQCMHLPEDYVICIHLRSVLETQFGIQFAPPQLADQFSIELNSSSQWLGKSFGFHGRHLQNAGHYPKVLLAL